MQKHEQVIPMMLLLMRKCQCVCCLKIAFLDFLTTSHLNYWPHSVQDLLLFYYFIYLVSDYFSHDSSLKFSFIKKTINHKIGRDHIYFFLELNIIFSTPPFLFILSKLRVVFICCKIPFIMSLALIIYRLKYF